MSFWVTCKKWYIVSKGEEELTVSYFKTKKVVHVREFFNKLHCIYSYLNDYLFFLDFFQVSQLVVSEIVRRSNMASRIAAIEKWAAVADISRCLHNFNGVLQVCAAFTNSSVFRLKKTWEKVSKTVYIIMSSL
jgi:hypothetical protein